MQDDDLNNDDLDDDIESGAGEMPDQQADDLTDDDALEDADFAVLNRTTTQARRGTGKQRNPLRPVVKNLSGKRNACKELMHYENAAARAATSDKPTLEDPDIDLIRIV